MFSLICDWINGWENSREAGDLRCYRTHYDVIVMEIGHRSGNGTQASKLSAATAIIIRIDLFS